MRTERRAVRRYAYYGIRSDATLDPVDQVLPDIRRLIRPLYVTRRHTRVRRRCRGPDLRLGCCAATLTKVNCACAATTVAHSGNQEESVEVVEVRFPEGGRGEVIVALRVSGSD